MVHTGTAESQCNNIRIYFCYTPYNTAPLLDAYNYSYISITFSISVVMKPCYSFTNSYIYCVYLNSSDLIRCKGLYLIYSSTLWSILCPSALNSKFSLGFMQYLKLLKSFYLDFFVLQNSSLYWNEQKSWYCTISNSYYWQTYCQNTVQPFTFINTQWFRNCPIHINVRHARF